MNPRFPSNQDCPALQGLSLRAWVGGALSAAVLAHFAALAEPPQPVSAEPPRLAIEPVVTSANPTAEASETSLGTLPFGTFTHDSGPGLAKANQESAQARLEASARKLTPEEAGGPYPYLKRQPGWRSVAELFNPFAPLPRVDETSALAFETRVPLRPSLPRIPSDAAWLEGGLSLLSLATAR